MGLLVLDMRSISLRREDPATREGEALARWQPWTRCHERRGGVVSPTPQRLVGAFRAAGHPVVFSRLAALPPDGRDRWFSQRKPGWNDLPLPTDEWTSPIAPEPRRGRTRS